MCNDLEEMIYSRNELNINEIIIIRSKEFLSEYKKLVEK